MMVDHPKVTTLGIGVAIAAEQLRLDLEQLQRQSKRLLLVGCAVPAGDKK